MTKSTYFFVSLFTLALLTSCTKNRAISGFDSELFAKAQKTDGFVYYNLSSEYLKSPIQSGHKSVYVRTKYNDIAATMLDDKGLVISGDVFPDGSLIVNEMSSTQSAPEKYAIMFKDPKNEFADKNGWVWTYLNADNTIIEPSSRKGISCVKCHSVGNSTLMSNYFLGTK